MNLSNGRAFSSRSRRGIKFEPRQKAKQIIEIARQDCRDRVGHPSTEQADAGVERRNELKALARSKVGNRLFVEVGSIISVRAPAAERLFTRIEIRVAIPAKQSSRRREEERVRVDVEKTRTGLEFGLLLDQPAVDGRIEREEFRTIGLGSSDLFAVLPEVPDLGVEPLEHLHETCGRLAEQEHKDGCIAIDCPKGLKAPSQLHRRDLRTSERQRIENCFHGGITFPISSDHPTRLRQ